MKPGYKQSQVGVIPEDWLERSVGKLIADGIIEKPIDGNHGNIHPKSGDFVEHGIPFVMANNVQGGQVDLVNCSFIRKQQADSLQKGFSKTGDVLLTHKATIGNTAIVGEIPFEYIMLTPQVTYYRVANGDRLSNLYLRQYFDSTGFQSVLLALAGGGTRSYIGIKAQHQLPVVIPPTAIEQRAIAEALSDVDELLGALDRLIAKKRDLKQAAMQQLLTAQTRLPGFSGEWNQQRLGDVATVSKGTQLHSSESDQSGRYAHLNGGITPSGYTHKANTVADTIAISEGGNSCGFVQFMRDPYWCGGHCYSVLPTRVNNYFLFHALKGQQPRIMGLRVGSGLPNVQKTALLEFELRFPRDLAEQTAIAEVLSEMDAELAALEQRREKTRALKQGMMQELLTGCTRLV